MKSDNIEAEDGEKPQKEKEGDNCPPNALAGIPLQEDAQWEQVAAMWNCMRKHKEHEEKKRLCIALHWQALVSYYASHRLL